MSIYFDYNIEYFYREKLLHLNAVVVVQTLTSKNYYQGSIVRGQLSRVNCLGVKSKCYLGLF